MQTSQSPLGAHPQLPKMAFPFDYYVSSVVNFISSLSSPVQIFLLVATVFVIRKLVASKVRRPPPEQDERLEPLKKRDFTLEELREYDGVKQKRVLLAINGNVFDVTRGKDFYGPGKRAAVIRACIMICTDGICSGSPCMLFGGNLTLLCCFLVSSD